MKEGFVIMKEDIKIMAFYLPQFHRFPENDKWWGEGFTEWENVKKAKSLFKFHMQPRVPKDHYYYDLLKEEVISEQMKLAKQYGLYGFCYYHYWFDGKLLLQKPLEIMLKMKDKINYCFCWANEPWTRAWDGRQNDILMPQRYGGEKEWEQHFQYLIPFFKDEYYIKIDKKPMLLIYRTSNIPKCDDMIEYWDRRCKESGLEGIYVIEELNSFQKKPDCKYTEGLLEFEPMYTLKFGRSILLRIYDKIYAKIHNKIYKNSLLLYSYDNIWKCIIKRRKNEKLGKQLYPGAFVDWDNTLRKGKKGLVMRGASPEKFEQYLSVQKKKAKKLNSEYIFINAWNEWGEGTYLEMDERYQDTYLRAVYKVNKE